MDWFSDNMAFLFSGIGTAVISGTAGFFIGRKYESRVKKRTIKQIQKAGDGSLLIQAGQDSTISK